MEHVSFKNRDLTHHFKSRNECMKHHCSRKRPSTPRAQIRTRLIRGTPFEVHCSKPMPQTNHRQNHCNILVMHVGDDSGMIAHVLRALLDSGTCARRPTRVSTFFQEMFHDNATRQRVGHAHEVKIACARGTYTCRPQLLEARLTTSNLRRRHRHRRHRRCRPPSSSSSSLPAAPPARTMVYKSCVFVHVVQVIVAVAVVALVVVVVMSSPALGRPNAPGGDSCCAGQCPHDKLSPISLCVLRASEKQRPGLSQMPCI